MIPDLLQGAAGFCASAALSALAVLGLLLLAFMAEVFTDGHVQVPSRTAERIALGAAAVFLLSTAFLIFCLPLLLLFSLPIKHLLALALSGAFAWLSVGLREPQS